MKSINATLSTAQKTASSPAIARISLADNNHLHLAQFYDSAVAGKTIIACLALSFWLAYHFPP